MQSRLDRCVRVEWGAPGTRPTPGAKKISRARCVQVLLNGPQVVADTRASDSRFFALGRTDHGQCVFLVFKVVGDSIRIVAAREMTAAEREAWESAAAEAAAV